MQLKSITISQYGDITTTVTGQPSSWRPEYDPVVAWLTFTDAMWLDVLENVSTYTSSVNHVNMHHPRGKCDVFFCQSCVNVYRYWYYYHNKSKYACRLLLNKPIRYQNTRGISFNWCCLNACNAKRKWAPHDGKYSLLQIRAVLLTRILATAPLLLPFWLKNRMDLDEKQIRVANVVASFRIYLGMARIQLCIFMDIKASCITNSGHRGCTFLGTVAVDNFLSMAMQGVNWSPPGQNDRHFGRRQF